MNDLVGQPDPAWSQQMARGRSAASELADILRGPQAQQAMQMMSARMAPVQQQGWATRDPSLLEGVAQFAQNMRGQSMMKELQEQARVLRGEQQAGNEAQLQQRAFERDQDYQRKLSRDEQTFERNRQLANEGRNAVRGDGTVYRNKDGDLRTIFMTGRGPVDASGNRITDMDGWEEVSRANQYKSVFGGGARTSKEREAIAREYMGLDDLNQIQNIATEFTPDDEAVLNRATKDVVTKAFTPSEFENYVNTQLKGASPQVKKYLEAVNRYSANVRRGLSGAALTRMELALSEQFLPSASGLKFEDRQRRIDASADQHRRMLENMGRVAQRDPNYYLQGAPEYRSWEERQKTRATPSQQATTLDLQAIGTQLQQMQSRMAELQAKQAQ